MEEKKRSRIVKFTTKVIAGIILGIFVALVALYFRGTFRGSFIQEDLATPEELREISVADADRNYVFDRILFSEYDLTTGKERITPVSLESYGTIIDLLKGSTYVERDDFTLLKFEEENPAKLTIYVSPEEEIQGKTLRLAYQTLEFLKQSDYFRVEIKGREGPYIWDYYRYPLAYDKVKEIVTENDREE